MPKRRPPRHSTRVNPLAARLNRAATDPTALPPLAPKPPAEPPPQEVQEAIDDETPLVLNQTPEVESEIVVDKGTAQPPLAGDSPMVRASGASTESRPSGTYAAGGSSLFSFRLRLRGSVASKYEAAAARAACDPEEVMEATLVRQADLLTVDTPLTFSDEERRSIIDSLGTADPESIVRHIRNLVSAAAVTVNGTPVSTLHFTSQQLERVASRCAAGETLSGKLQEYADYGVNLQTGLA